MRRYKTIRTGQKASGFENNELDCLYGFWELEDQLGIRPDPRTRHANVAHIPEIELAAPSTRAVVRPGE